MFLIDLIRVVVTLVLLAAANWYRRLVDSGRWLPTEARLL
jgi:hypothetical protein